MDNCRRLTFRHLDAEQAFALRILFAAQLRIAPDQREMDFDITGIELERLVQVSYSVFHATGFNKRPSEDQLCTGRGRGCGRRFFGIWERSRGIVS